MKLEELGKLVYDNGNTFNATLEFVAQITKADIGSVSVEPTIIGIADLREDKVRESLDINSVLMNAKNKDGRYFVVPQVVE